MVGLQEQQFIDTINQAVTSANREPVEEQPFLMQKHPAMKEKEGGKRPREQQQFQKSFSVFSKRRQQLFKQKPPDKRFLKGHFFVRQRTERKGRGRERLSKMPLFFF